MEQRSEEWFDARAGRLTASMFRAVLAKPGTALREGYMEQVVADLQGAPRFETEDKPWFLHGKLYEPEALSYYAFVKGVDVKQVGLIVHPEHPFIGASPDGLIASEGGVEIKCSKSWREHQKVVAGGMPSVHRPQVQGNMWVTGRQWWDFINYYRSPDTGARAISIWRVERDEEYMRRLEDACLAFWEEVQRRLNG